MYSLKKGFFSVDDAWTNFFPADDADFRKDSHNFCDHLLNLPDKIKKAGLEKPDFSDLHRPPRFFLFH
jgi:hypothetical protein